MNRPRGVVFRLANGDSDVPLLSAQDHKRIFDDDSWSEYRSMGAFAPSPLMDDSLQSRIEREIVQPVLRGMARKEIRFGFLYCGLC